MGPCLMDETVLDPPRVTRPRPHHLRWVAVTVAVVTIGAFIVWWTRPDAFGPYGNAVSAQLVVGETLDVNLSVTSIQEQVTTHALEPRITENTADADIDVVLCELDGDDRLGAGTGELDRYCTSVRPATAGQIDWRRNDLMVRVTPRRAGTVRIEGTEIGYTRGWRHLRQTGTQHTGTAVVLTAR